MDLRTEEPFWLMRSGIIQSFPSIKKSANTEVVILGGGITGSLIAFYLAKAGISAILIDKRKIGMGSTCASTALLQYEIDTPLQELQGYVGFENAARSYQLCIEAITKIEKIVKELNVEVGFSKRRSFYYASNKSDAKELPKEYELRKQVGIDLEYWEEEEIKNKFGFSASAALMSKDGAQIDAYSFTHHLLDYAQKNGVKVFDDSEVTEIIHHKNSVELTTKYGLKIDAKKLIIASGYESQQFLSKKIVQFNSSFAIVSEPFEQKELWLDNCLIWETARPYLYLRTTDDNRVLIGGKDEEFYNPQKRDALNDKKAMQLEKEFNKLFPDLLFRTDFKWAGTFAETKDGLPYIGAVDERPNTYFAMGFGGNGIVFSLLAAEIIRDELTGKQNNDAKIFGFDR
ncbi:FAD-dependent oxidoreductase [Emticicia sp. W12TSBA100-4]|uniref:NAD(P)/FAD-dependent oxidoreductase n=1 Tax=Emticicia sp. W12TSBA100-4 TaxID=3160965 RepID=UPI00330580E6